MRQKIVAGNWKMNKTLDEAYDLVHNLIDMLTDDVLGDTDVIIAPPSIILPDVVEELWDVDYISVAAQNCHHKTHGAFTGEVSAGMIASLEADAVIVGHSERRQYFGETDAMIAEKINRCLEQDLIPIYCCGETLEQRKAGQHFEVVSGQIQEALFHLNEDEITEVVIAYEPVWAIGTGETATPAQAQEIHAHIRHQIAQKFGDAIANETSILYGGSCNPGNAVEIFSQPDVDGGLIGGASLKADDFTAIVQAMTTVERSKLS
jgi:triosephosphate isomerase